VIRHRTALMLNHQSRERQAAGPAHESGAGRVKDGATLQAARLRELGKLIHALEGREPAPARVGTLHKAFEKPRHRAPPPGVSAD